MLALVVPLVGCGAQAEPATPTAAPATAFAAAMNADIAGDDGHLWALVIGHDGDRNAPSARAFERTRSSGWRQLPGLPQQVDTGMPISAAAFRGGLCTSIGIQAPGRSSSVFCHSEKGWTDISRESPLARAKIVQLAVSRGELHALVVETASAGSRRTVHRIYRWRGGKWRQIGEGLVSSSGIAQLGTSRGAEQAPGLVIENSGTRHPTRAVYRLAGGRWGREGPVLRGATVGPTTSGPVSTGHGTLLAVNEANVEPWRFSVFVNRPGEDWRKVTGGRFNVGAGYAQGSLTATASGIWALWFEHTPRTGAFPFREQIFVARVGTSGSRVEHPVTLHEGLSIGPGDLDVVDGLGRTWAMYMVTMPDGTLQTRIRPLPG